MSSEHNTVCSTYNTDFDIAVRSYVTGSSTAATWVEAVASLQDTLNESIQKAYG